MVQLSRNIPFLFPQKHGALTMLQTLNSRGSIEIMLWTRPTAEVGLVGWYCWMFFGVWTWPNLTQTPLLDLFSRPSTGGVSRCGQIGLFGLRLTVRNVRYRSRTLPHSRRKGWRPIIQGHRPRPNGQSLSNGTKPCRFWQPSGLFMGIRASHCYCVCPYKIDRSQYSHLLFSLE